MINSILTRGKTLLCIVSFGVIIGVVGILHGGASLLQGDTLVESHQVAAMPEDWPNSIFYETMKGSPIFSILTGISYSFLGSLAILISCLLILHSLFFLGKKNGLLIFALLNVAVFLFGAGKGTPLVMGIPLLLAGIVLGILKKKTVRSVSVKKNILRLFYIFYGLQIFSWVLFCPGLVIISYYQEIPQALLLFDFMLMPVSILGALILGLIYDQST